MKGQPGARTALPPDVWGVLCSCASQTSSDLCTHVCAGEGMGASVNTCVFGSQPQSRVVVCEYTAMRCVRASGSQLTWKTLPTELWGWLLRVHADIFTHREQAWDTGSWPRLG